MRRGDSTATSVGWQEPGPGRRGALLALGLALAACGGGSEGAAADGSAPVDVATPADAGRADGTTTDAAVIDAGLDAGRGDAGPDGAIPDTGLPDAGRDAGGAPDGAPGCPAGTEARSGRCVDPLPWPAPAGPRVGDALCLAAEPPQGAGPLEDARRAFFFEQAAAMGVRALRFDLRWDHLERQPGVFDFAATDRQVDGARAAGMEIIGLLAYGNPWASERGREAADPFFPPDDPADFGRYVSAVVAHYRGRVSRWEIWNEQNAGYRFWKGTGTVSGDPAAYGALLEAAGGAARAVDPQAQVSFGGVFLLPQAIIGGEAFAEAMYLARPGVGAAFDTFSYHPYSAYPPRNPPEFRGRALGADQVPIDETARRMYALVERHEGRRKPLWVTEVGWPTRDLSELDHARFTVRSTLLLVKEGVEHVCHYTFSDGDPARSYLAPWEQFFGLFEWDADPTDGTTARPKAVVAALRALHGTLGALRFSVDLGARYGHEETWHLGFADEAGRRVHALWTVEGDREVRLPAEAPLRRVPMRGDCGEACELTPGPDGLVVVPVTPSPVYLVEAGP